MLTISLMTLTIAALPWAAQPGGLNGVTHRGVTATAAPALVENAQRLVTQGQATGMRFREMDRNNDGVISRSEWQGSDQSFRVHDWNGDGRLSGEEVRVGAARNERWDQQDFDPRARDRFTTWNETGFSSLDHNRDGRIEANEWHYDTESFVRADRNRDGVLSRSEFFGTGVDDDRNDTFANLDVNGDGRIERREWHASADAFEWLDRNRDGVLSRAEVVGGGRARRGVASDVSGQFSSLDYNRDGVISRNEWHWSRGSFDQRDLNRDGILTPREFAAAGSAVAGTSGRVVRVNPSQRWTDTGLTVRAGDTITFSAEGTAQLSDGGNDIATPAGSRTGRRAAEAPLRQDPAGGLIARIGNSEPMYIGAQRTVTAPVSGTLQLGVNDDHLPDNSGEYLVTINTQGR